MSLRTALYFISKFVLASLLTLSAASAAELILKNGDRINGELVGSDGTLLTWASESFGELQVSVDQIKAVNTNQLFKIAGYDSACNFSSPTEVSCFDDHADPIEWVLSSKIEPWSTFKDEYSNDGYIRLAGKNERGNKISDSLTIEAETSWAKADIKHRVFAYYDGDRPDGSEETTNEYRLQYYFDWYFRDRMYLNSYAAIEADQKSGIDSRYRLGTGFGYRLVQTDNHKLTIEAGPSWLTETTSSEFGGDTSDRLAVRWYLDWSYSFVNELSLFHNHEYLYSNTDDHRHQTTLRSGLHYPLGKGMYTELRHEFTYDSEPVDLNEPEDSKFTIGVGYNW